MRALIIIIGVFFFVPPHLLAQKAKTAEDYLLGKLEKLARDREEVARIDTVAVTGSEDPGFNLHVEYTSNCWDSSFEMEMFNRAFSGLVHYRLHQKGYPVARSLFIVHCRTRGRFGSHSRKPFVRMSLSADRLNKINWDRKSHILIVRIAKLQEYDYF